MQIYCVWTSRLGFKSSSITILDAGEIKLHRVVNMGGDRLTSGLAETLGISYHEAEGIKVGLPSEVQANLEPLIVPLGRELRASIDFFENKNDRTVSTIYVSGGSVRSECVVQTLQSELMVPCKTWSPTKFLDSALPPDKAKDLDAVAPQLNVAIGAVAALIAH